MSTLDNKIKRKIENELELSGSENLYIKEIHRICNNFSENESVKMEKYAQSLLDANNEKQEFYRTKLSNLNFSIVTVLKIFNQNWPSLVSTKELYDIDMTEEAKLLDSYTRYINNINTIKVEKIEEEITELQKSGGNLKKIKTLSESIKRLKAKKNIFDSSKSTDRAKESQIGKAIKFLVAYNVIKKEAPNLYKLNMEHWFNYQRYSLHNERMLDELLPILVSFLKYNAPNKVDNFLNHLDTLVGLTIRAPKNHSTFANIENYIIQIINNDDNPIMSFEVLNENTNESLDQKTSFINVNELQIIFDKTGQKILRFSENATNYKIPIKDIFFINVPDATENSMKRENGDFVIYNDEYTEKIDDAAHKAKVEKRKKDHNLSYQSKDHSVIFEADSNMKDYFEMKVFKDTKIYMEEDKKETFILEELNSVLDNPKTLDDFKSKILVTGSNTIDEILDCAQRNAKNVKLLHPPFIIKRLGEVIRETEIKYKVRR